MLRKVLVSALVILAVVAAFSSGSLKLLGIVKELEGVNTLAQTLDGRLVVAGSRDGSVLVYRGTELKRFIPSMGIEVVSVAVSEDNEEFVALTAEGEVLLWKKTDSQPYYQQKLFIRPNVGEFLAVALSGKRLSGSKLLAVATEDKIFVYDLITKPSLVATLPVLGVFKGMYFRNVAQLTLVYDDMIVVDALGSASEILLPAVVDAFAPIYGDSRVLIASGRNLFMVNLQNGAIDAVRFDARNLAGSIKVMAVSAYPKKERVVFIADSMNNFYVGKLNLAERSLQYVPLYRNDTISDVLSAVIEPFADIKTEVFVGTKYPVDKQSFRVIVGTKSSLSEIMFVWDAVSSSYRTTVSKDFRYYGVKELKNFFVTRVDGQLVVLDGSEVKLWPFVRIIEDAWAKVPPTVLNVKPMMDVIDVTMISEFRRIFITDGKEVMQLSAKSLTNLNLDSMEVVDRFYVHKESDEDVKFVKLDARKIDKSGSSNYYIIAVQDDGLLVLKTIDGKESIVLGERSSNKLIDFRLFEKQDAKGVKIEEIWGVTIHADGTVKLWSLLEDILIAELKTGLLYTNPELIAVSSKGTYLAVVTDRYVRLYRIKDIQNEKKYTPFRSIQRPDAIRIETAMVAASPRITSIAILDQKEGSLLFLGRSDGTVVSLDVETGAPKHPAIVMHNGAVKMIRVIEREGKQYLLTYGEDGAIKIWLWQPN